MLKTENNHHKKRVMELETELEKLSGQLNLQQRIHHHTKIKEENNLLMAQNEELSLKLRRTEGILLHIRQELANYRKANGKSPFINFDEEQRLKNQFQETEGERLQLAQKLVGLCTSILKAAGVTRPASEINISVAEESLDMLKNQIESLQRELKDAKRENERAKMEQKKADERVMKLAEEHMKEKEKAYMKIIELEAQLDAKQALEIEIERLRGALAVMKYMEDDGDLEAREKLLDKEEEFEDLLALHSVLFVRELASNGELQVARKELIEGMKGQNWRRGSIGIKRMGKIDSHLIHIGTKRKVPESETGNVATDKHPHVYNPSGNKYVVLEHENLDGGRKATLREDIRFLSWNGKSQR